MKKLPEPFRSAVRQCYRDVKTFPHVYDGYASLGGMVNALIELDLCNSDYNTVLSPNEFDILRRLREKFWHLQDQGLRPGDNERRCL